MSKVILNGYYPDFSTQYLVPKLLFSGVNPYVQGEGLFTIQVYPPTTSLLYAPLTLLTLEQASYVFTFLSILSVISSIVLLSKIVGVRFFSTHNLVLSILIFIFFPLKFTLGMGQINNFILLLLVFSLWLIKRNQEFKAGLVIGLSIALKLFPVFLPLFFFIKTKTLPRDYIDKFHWSGFFNVRIFNKRIWIWPSQVVENGKLLMGIITSIALLALVVLLLVPIEVIGYFLFDVVPNVATSWKLDYYNQALSGFVGRHFGVALMGTIIKLILSGIISFTTIFAVAKNEKADFLTIALKFSTLITVSLLVNTFSWQHHFVWMIIPLYLTYFYLLKNNFTKKYFIILFLSYILVATNLKNPEIFPTIFQSHVFFGGVLLLILQIKILFDRDKK